MAPGILCGKCLRFRLNGDFEFNRRHDTYKRPEEMTTPTPIFSCHEPGTLSSVDACIYRSLVEFQLLDAHSRQAFSLRVFPFVFSIIHVILFLTCMNLGRTSRRSSDTPSASSSIPRMLRWDSFRPQLQLYDKTREAISFGGLVLRFHFWPPNYQTVKLISLTCFVICCLASSGITTCDEPSWFELSRVT